MQQREHAFADAIGHSSSKDADTARRDALLSEVGQALAARVAGFLLLDARDESRAVSLLVSTGLQCDEALAQAARKQLAMQYEDPRIAYGLRHRQVPYRCADIIPPADFRATRVYRELLWPIGMEYSLMIQYSDVPEVFAAVSFLRGAGDGPFSADDLHTLHALLPRLREGLTPDERLAGPQEPGGETRGFGTRSLQFPLDHLPIGIVIASETGRIEHVNAEAERIFELNDGIRAQNDEIQIALTDTRKKMRTAMARAAHNGEDVALPLRRLSGQLPFLCLIQPLPPERRTDTLAAAQHLMLHVCDPDRAFSLPLRTLQDMFGLTLTEARVLERLIAGLNAKQIAILHRVEESTVRSQLKSLYMKTGTSRQAELLRRVLTSPVWLARCTP